MRTEQFYLLPRYFDRAHCWRVDIESEYGEQIDSTGYHASRTHAIAAAHRLAWRANDNAACTVVGDCKGWKI